MSTTAGDDDWAATDTADDSAPSPDDDDGSPDPWNGDCDSSVVDGGAVWDTSRHA